MADGDAPSDPTSADPMAYYVLVDSATGKILISGYCQQSDLQHQAKEGQVTVQLTPEQVGINGMSHSYNVATGQFVQIMTDLQQAQVAKVKMLKLLCGRTIDGGFTSSALGSPHQYPSAETDQSNMLRISIAGGELWCAVADVWSMVTHTAEQGKLVLADFGTACDASRARLADLTNQVNATTTFEELGAIAW